MIRHQTEQQVVFSIISDRNNYPNYTYNLTLAAATAATPSYDADGNLLSDGVRSYQ